MARSASKQLSLGVLLLAVGGVLLITRIADVKAAPAWLLGLGGAFVLLGILRRTFAALVPGMVLLGLGAGMLLGDEAVAGLPEWTWILLALGAGFVGIYLLGAAVKLRPHWWSLLVGGILVGIGGMRIVRDFRLLPPEVVIAVRTWWPAGLVLAGLWLLVRALR